MQYTVIFHGCKNGNFQMKLAMFLFIFALNIDRGYTLESPEARTEAVLTSTHDLCFRVKIRKKNANPSFTM